MKKRLFTSILILLAVMALPGMAWGDTKSTVLEVDYAAKATDTWQVTSGNTGSQQVTRGTATTIGGVSYNPFSVVKDGTTLLEEHGVYVSSGNFYLSCTGSQYIGLRCTNTDGASLAIKGLLAGDVIEVATNGGAANSSTPTVSAPSDAVNATISESTGVYKHDFTHDTSRSAYYYKYDITVSADGDVSFNVAQNCYIAYIKVVRSGSETPVTQYTVTAESTNADQGTVAITDASSDNKYDQGSSVTVTATAKSGYEFDYWTNGESTDSYSTENPLIIASLGADFALKAHFKKTAVVPTEFSYDTFDFKNFVIENDLENGTKPTWGATIDGADVQVLTYVSGSINQTFGNRFAAGPVAQNATDNCFKFRNYAKEKSGTDQTYTGLYSQYADRTFSILGLNVGDRITFTFANANTTLTYGNNVSVVNNQTITVTEAGRMDFKAVAGVVITQVKIEAPLTQYTVTAESTNADQGTVAITDASSDNKYDQGSSVTVTATAKSGYEFDYWTNGESTDSYSTENPLTISNLGADFALKAHFKKTAVVPTEFSYGTFDFKQFVIDNSLSNGTKPTWGATIDGADVQVLTYVSGSINQTFGNRFAAGPVAQNATDNCFKFRKDDGDTYTGLYSQYADRTFSILGLNVGDRITFTFANANTTLTYGDNVSVVNNQTITVTEAGRMDFKAVAGVVITQVKIEAPLTQYTVTAESSNTDQGTVAITNASSDNKYDQGSSVTVTATANSGYEFDYWTNGESTDSYSTENPLTIASLGADFALKAHFKQTAVVPTEFSYGTFDFKQFVIDNSLSNGTKPTWGATIDGADAQVLTYASGSVNETFGNRFAAGPVAQNATDNCFKFRKDDGDTYTGLYSQYADRTFSILGLNVGDRITFTFANANTTLTYGNNVSVVNNQTITVTEAGRMDFKAVAGVVITQVKIEAPLTQYTVTAESSNTDQGTVAITNASSDNKYDQGSSVTVTATAKSGYEFDYWTNGESTDSYSTENPLTIASLGADFALKAHFKAQSTTPVTSSYWTYNYAQMAVAMITADNTKKSITWTRNGDNSSKLTVNSNAVYPVYIDAYQSEGNLMADRGDGILKFGDVYNIGLTNNSNATNYYAIKNVKANDIIKIAYNGGGNSSAMKELPSLEDLYNATESSETSTYTLNFNYGGKDRTLNYTEKTLTVTADGPVGFSLKDGYIAKITVGTAYAVNATVETAGTGTVSVTSPEYMQIGDEFIEGTNVTLKAEAASGYEFKAWKEGDTQVATTAEYTIENLSANKSLTAVFEQSVVNYTIKVVAGENGSVKVEKGEDDVTTAVAAGAEYVTGTSLKLTAIPAEGYEFVNWTNGTTEVSTDNPYTVSLTGNIELTANFKEYVAPVEATVGETRNWLFNDLTTGDVYSSITEIDGAYLRASNSNPGSRTMTVTDLTPQTLKFADGAEVSVSKYLAVGHSMYPLAFTESSTAASTTANENGTIGSGSFAVNTTVAGTIYAKIGTTADQNVRIYCTDAISSPKTFALTAEGGIQEVSYTTTAENGGTFFIGGVGGKYDIYAVRFVPTSEATKYTLTVGEVTNGAITVKDGGTTIDGSAQVLPGATLTLTATPDDGYQLKEWQNGSGSAIGAIQNSMVTTVAMPAEAMTVKAVFEVQPESVTAITKDQTLTFDNYATGISLSGSKVYAANDNLYINGHSDSAPAQVTANGISEGVTLGSATGVTVGKSLWMRGGNDKDLSGKAVNSYVQDAIGLNISEKGLLYVLLSGKTSDTDRYFNIYVNGVKNQTKIADNNPVVISQAITETSDVFITVSGGDWRAYAIRFEAVSFTEQETDDTESGSKVYAVVTDDGATIAAASIADTDETITISEVDGKPVKDIAAGVFTESNTANVSAIDLSDTQVTMAGERTEIPALKNIDASTLIYLPSTASVTGTNVVVKSGSGETATYTCSDFQVDNDKLEDGKSVTVPKKFTATKAELKRTFTADKKCTVCLPYDFTAPTDGKFFVFNGISDGKVQMKETTELKANVPYIFQPAGDSSITGENVEVSISDAPQTENDVDFTFVGTYEETIWTNPEGIYGFAAEDKDGSTAGSFVRAGNNASIMACRAYLKYTGAEIISDVASTRGMRELPKTLEIEWLASDGSKITTGIHKALTDDDSEAPAYNVRGQRVDKSYKGLVIVNGKKVVRK